jgi:hypothetical protein
MTIVTYELSPELDVGVDHADIHQDMFKDGDALNYNAITQIVGRFKFAKLQYNFALFATFDVDLTTEQITGLQDCKFVGYSTGAGNSTSFTLTGGFMAPESSGSDDWEDSAGFANWANANSVLFAEWNNGTETDASVWHGDVPAFSGETMTVQTSILAEWSIGDGETLTPTNVVSGMTAQLKSYLLANESLRGHRVAGAIPVCFQLFRPFSVTVNSYQVLYTETFGTSPQLVVEYEIQRYMTAETSAQRAIEGRVVSGVQISGEAIINEGISAIPSIRSRN